MINGLSSNYPRATEQGRYRRKKSLTSSVRTWRRFTILQKNHELGIMLLVIGGALLVLPDVPMVAALTLGG